MSDKEEFFQHENQAFPPSLSQAGHLNKGVKADLVGCLEEFKNSIVTMPPQADVTILDGATVLHLLHPKFSKNICWLCQRCIFTIFLKQLQSSVRLDVIWDRYDQKSLKTQERINQRTGIRRHVEPSASLPPNWADFLWRDKNKEELFSFLTKVPVPLDTPNQVI